MRISEQLLFSAIAAQLQRNLESTLNIQEQISAGKRILRPSDDPTAHTQILRDNTVLAQTDQYLRNIGQVDPFMSATAGALQSAQDQLVRLRELAIQASTLTISASDRARMATEVQQIFNELVSLSNVRFEDQHLFAGSQTDSAAFDSTGTYQGNSVELSVLVGKGQTVIKNLPGNRVFNGTGVTGGVDIFSTVQNFQTALQNNNLTNIATAFDELVTAQGQLGNELALIGSRQSRLVSSRTMLEDLKILTLGARSDREDLDLTQAVSDLALKQNALEAIRAVSGGFLGQSLLDFLQ